MGMQTQFNDPSRRRMEPDRNRRRGLMTQPAEKSKDELDHDLDEALQDTFPASDPVSIVSKFRSGRRRKHRKDETEAPSVDRREKP